MIIVVPRKHTPLYGSLTSEPMAEHDAIISIISVTIYVSPEYVVSAEEGVIGLKKTASIIAGLLLVTVTPVRVPLTLLATDQSRLTIWLRGAGYERCCGPVLD